MIIKVDKILLDSPLAAGMIGGVTIADPGSRRKLGNCLCNRQIESAKQVWFIEFRLEDLDVDHLKTGRRGWHRLRC